MKPIQFLLFFGIAMFIFSCSEDESPAVQIDQPVALRIFDMDNAGNSSDIRVFFNAASLEAVSEYRIMFVPSSSAASFDLTQAQAVIAGAYDAISPFSPGNIRKNITADKTDTDGNAIGNGSKVVAFVLAVSSRTDVESVLSSPSEEFELEDTEIFDLYISSSRRHSVELYDGVTGEHIKTFISPGTAGLNDVQEVRFGKDGALYVSSMGSTAILKFNGQTGDFIESFTSGYELDRPTKMNYGPDGLLYVSQWGNTRDAVVKFDTTSGTFVGEVLPSYFQGMDQTWDDDGNLYITSWGIPDVRKFDSQGNALGVLINSSLTGPVNLWIDGDDLYVSDWSVGQVKIFDKNSGAFKSTFVTGLTRVEGYLFDGKGNLFLCDWQNNVVNRYDAITGEFREEFINDQVNLNTPNSITFGPNQRPD